MTTGSVRRCSSDPWRRKATRSSGRRSTRPLWRRASWRHRRRCCCSNAGADPGASGRWSNTSPGTAVHISCIWTDPLCHGNSCVTRTSSRRRTWRHNGDTCDCRRRLRPVRWSACRSKSWRGDPPPPWRRSGPGGWRCVWRRWVSWTAAGWGKLLKRWGFWCTVKKNNKVWDDTSTKNVIQFPAV